MAEFEAIVDALIARELPLAKSLDHAVLYGHPVKRAPACYMANPDAI